MNRKAKKNHDYSLVVEIKLAKILEKTKGKN